LCGQFPAKNLAIRKICENDMFYVYGKFCGNRLKIKEVEAWWRVGMHFFQAWKKSVD
jgi:hypothetical protein